MSAKLLYTLSSSDDNQNLHKQIGCMNGFLHFFDRRHFISGRTIHRRLPPGEGSGQQRDGNKTGKRSKEKHHSVAKEVQRNNVEPSSASTSSTGSTTMSSLEYDSSIKSVRSPFYETTASETNSQGDSKVNQPPFSPYRSNPTPVATPKREPTTNQLDSPRFLHPSKLDSPKLTSLNESFHSISSNQSAPVTPCRKKDASRMSYDGTETREKYATGSKFGDLPRLSLDSRQRTINRSISESRKDLQHTDQLEEPGSYRPPSNIVVKLMGLENIPDYSPTHKKHIESDRFSSCGRFDSLSRSSRTIDESQEIRVLDSPRNNSTESRTPRLRNKPAARKRRDGYPDCGKTDVKSQEIQPKSPNQALTLYGEIERKLADLDFKKSGKDLRALKQILEAIHREKTMNEAKKENHPSGCLADMSINSNIRQTRSPQKGQMPQKLQVSRHPQVIKSRTTKSAKTVRDSAKGEASNIHNVSLPILNRQRCDQRDANVLDSVDEKATKTYCSREPTSQTQSIISRDLRERAPRPVRTAKATEHETKGTIGRSVRISETGSTRMYRRNRVSENQSHTPVTTLITRTKQHNQQTVGPRPLNQKLQSKSSILQNSNVDFSHLTADIACINQQRNSRLLLIDNGSFCQADSNSPERMKGDQSFAELPIDMKEQPSPVSVLDVKFYGDESPSPVKKKLTAFTDDDSTSTTTENELKDIEIIDSPYSTRLGFSCDSDHQRREKFKESGHAPKQLSSNQGGNTTSSMTPQKDIKLETEYVRDILLASGFLDNPNCIEVNPSVYQSKGTLNPNLFFVLEQTRGNKLLSHDDTKSKTINRPCDKHRRLIFDVVNEILTNKLPSIGMGHHPQLLLNRLSGFKNDQQLLQEILKEVDGLQANCFCQSVDDEETFLRSIIERDLMNRSANWTDSNSEISGLVLDIERLIFRDLIGELVYEEAPHLQAPK